MTTVIGDINDWYWVVAASATNVYSSATQTSVANNAAAYSTWLGNGNFGYAVDVTAMADNGSGKVRLTVSTSANVVSNQRWYFEGLTGSPLANGLQQITVVNGTTIDITAISFVASTLGTGARFRGASRAASQAEVDAVINNFNISAVLPASASFSPSGSTTLTNPMASLSVFTPSVGHNLFLAPANQPNSPAIGQVLEFRNESDFLIHVFTNSGTDLGTMGPKMSLTLRLADNSTVGGTWQETVGFSIFPYQKSRVVQLTAANNTSTPNTKMDIAATWAIHGRQNIAAPWIFTTGSATCDVGLTGPAVNGRDQSGAFSANSFIHFFAITRAADNNTANFATLASTSFSLPILPTGYTHHCYLFTARFNGSSQLIPIHVMGDTVYYDVNQPVLTSGTATASTSVSTASFVPTQASAALLFGRGVFASTAGAVGDLTIGVLTAASVFAFFRGSPAAGATDVVTPIIEMPNVASQFFYKLTDLVGTNDVIRTGDFSVYGFRVPNGDN